MGRFGSRMFVASFRYGQSLAIKSSFPKSFPATTTSGFTGLTGFGDDVDS
jgi:hypothetical protein